MRTSFLRYLKVFSFVTIVYFFFIGVVNIWVDPLNELGRNTMGLFYSTQRQGLKKIEVEEHDALLMGSSRVASINPDMIDCYTFINGAFSGAMPEEVYFALKRYLKDQKFVAIGLDFHVFNERQWPVAEMNEWPEHRFGFLEYIMTFKTFKYSIGTIQKSQTLKRKEREDLKPVEPGGEDFLAQVVEPLTVKEAVLDTGPADLTGFLKQEFFEKGQSPSVEDLIQEEKDSYDGALMMLREHHFRRFQFSEQRMEYLRKTKNLLEKKDLEYVVFINPIHEVVLDLIKEDEKYQIYLKWKKEVQNIFPNVYDFSESEYSKPKYYNKRDPIHYHGKVGSEFLNKIIPCLK